MPPTTNPHSLFLFLSKHNDAPEKTHRTALPARWLSGINVYRAGAAAETNNNEQAATRRRNDGGEKENNGDGGGDEILLGGAETVAQLRLTPGAVAQSAFFDEWSALATALAVLLANAAADSARAAAFSYSSVSLSSASFTSASSSSSSSPSSSSSLWKGTFYSSLWAIATAIYTLIKVEVDQARVLSSWSQLKESAVVGAGASGVALSLLLLSPKKATNEKKK